MDIKSVDVELLHCIRYKTPVLLEVVRAHDLLPVDCHTIL